MTPRDGINNIRDYEKFLRSRGFSCKESKVLARAYKDLESNSAVVIGASRQS